MTRKELIQVGYALLLERDGIATVLTPAGEPGTFHWDGADSYTEFETYRDSCKVAGIEPEESCKASVKRKASGGRQSRQTGNA